ncbi:MAG: hypothetical protein ACE5E6_11765 [Phycisphaerae bacterium]
MTGTGSARGLQWVTTGLCLGASLSATCRAPRRIDPIGVDNPVVGPLTIAVAPAVNLSGAADFDRIRVADIMASELSYAADVNVIPVNRVVAALANDRTGGVRSAEQALDLAARIGADAVLVFAITEYEPYDPPIIGMSAQLFGRRPGAGHGRVDPVALARQARLVATDKPVVGGMLAMAQRVFDASHEDVVHRVRAFAVQRDADDSPYGWRRNLVSQQAYMRFCCHAILRMLFNGPDGEKSQDPAGTKEVRKP